MSEGAAVDMYLNIDNDNFIDGLSSAADIAESWSDGMDAMIDNLINKFDELADGISQIIDPLSEATDEVDNLTDSVDAMDTSPIDDVVSSAGELIDPLTDATGETDNLDSSINNLDGSTIIEITNNYTDLSTTINEATQSNNEFNDSLQNTEGGASALGTALTGVAAVGIPATFMSWATSAGNYDDQISALNINMRGATNTGIELASNVGDMGKQYGITGGSARQFANSITLMGNKNMNTITDLTKNIRAMAFNAGNSFESTSEAFKKLARSGNLEARVFKQLGVTVEDFAETAGMGVDELSNKLKNMNPGERIDYLNEIFGKMPGVVAGAEAAADSFSTKVNKTDMGVGGLARRLGTLVMPSVMFFMELFNTVLDIVNKSISDMNPLLKFLVSAIMGVAGAVGFGVLAFSTLKSAMKMVGIMDTVGSLFKLAGVQDLAALKTRLFSGAIVHQKLVTKGAVIEAMAHAGAINIETAATNKGFMAKLRTIPTYTAQTASKVANTIATVALSIAVLAGASAETVATAATGGLTAALWAMTAALLANPWTWVAIAIIAVVVAIQQLGKYMGWWTDWASMIDSFAAGIKRLWSAFVNNPAVIGFINTLKSTWEGFKTAIMGAIEPILKPLRDFWNTIFPPQSGDFDIVRVLIDMFGRLGDEATNVWNTINDFFSNNPLGQMLSWLNPITILMFHFDDLKGAAILVWETINDFFSNNPLGQMLAWMNPITILLFKLDDLRQMWDALTQAWEEFASSAEGQAVLNSLAQAFAELQGAAGEIMDALGELWDSLFPPEAEAATTGASDGIDTVKDAVKEMNPYISVAKEVISIFAWVLKDIVLPAVRLVIDVFKKTKESIEWIIGAVDNTKAAFEQAWSAIAPYVTPVYDALKQVVCIIVGCSPGIIPAVKQIPGAFASAFGGLAALVWDTLSQIIESVIEFGTSIVTTAFESGAEFVQNLISNIQQLPEMIWNLLNNALGRVKSFAKQFVDNGIKAGKSFVDNLINNIKSLPSRAWSTFLQTLSRARSFVSSAASTMASGARSAVQGFISNITGMPGAVASEVSSIIQRMLSAGSSLYNYAVNIGKNIVKGLLEGLKKKSPGAMYRAIRDELLSMEEIIVDRTSDLAKASFNAAKAIVEGFGNPELEASIELNKKINNNSDSSSVNIKNPNDSSDDDGSGGGDTYVEIKNEYHFGDVKDPEDLERKLDKRDKNLKDEIMKIFGNPNPITGR